MREQCLLSAHLRVGTRIHEGTLINISENGAFCATRSCVEIGTAIQVRFRHPWSDAPVTAAAVVMRRSSSGDGLGPQPGVALALLDTLSDLEDTEANVSLSDSLAPGSMSSLRELRERAQAAEAMRSGGHPAVSSGSFAAVSSPDLSLPPEDGVTCTFEGTGREPTAAVVRNLSAAGFTILCPDPPHRGRLVRIEIDPADHGLHPARIAGKVTWSSATDDDAQAEGFGVHVLHFLSSADERRYHDLLLHQRTRGR